MEQMGAAGGMPGLDDDDEGDDEAEGDDEPAADKGEGEGKDSVSHTSFGDRELS